MRAVAGEKGDFARQKAGETPLFLARVFVAATSAARKPRARPRGPAPKAHPPARNPQKRPQIRASIVTLTSIHSAPGGVRRKRGFCTRLADIVCQGHDL